ncbi:polysaccharide deacetylase [Seiridium cupressi]
MISRLIASLTVGVLLLKVSASCSDLILDDFSNWSNGTNSVGGWIGDDGTMASISASDGILTFTPNGTSYFYETLACQSAVTNGYDAIIFSIQGPENGTAALEIQTSTSCSESAYASYYYAITGLTGSNQTINVPLSSFVGANLDAIQGFVWYGFSSSDEPWQLGDIELVCDENTQMTTATDSTSASLNIDRDAALSTSSASDVTIQASGTSTSAGASATTTSSCTNLLIDDWESQSRLTFLFYNAMLQPSSDDGTMSSIIVSDDHHVTITPNSTDSYFYSQTPCVNAQDTYGGISLPIKAPARTTFAIQLGSPATCGNDTDIANIYLTTTDLGWTFDGTEQLYSIPFSKFQGLDITKVHTIFFTALTNAVTFGPMSFYCGSTATGYVVPATTASSGPTSTVPAPSGTASALVIDDFSSEGANSMGFWHGADDGMSLTWSGKSLTIQTDDADLSFYTQIAQTCGDYTRYSDSYLHIVYSGSNRFSVALQQHNSQCNESIAPYPETWDSLEAARYSSGGDIYMPMSHFNINQTRAVGIALKGFYSTNSTVLSKVEIVPSVPAGFTIPSKLASGKLVFACTRPNSFAFAIDDGEPTLAQQVMQVVKEEGIKVTFFTVGAPLEDSSTNLTIVYNEMMAEGHQIALHSFTHPKMEGLPSYEAIDWEYNNDVTAAAQAFNGLHTPYFRPPFGTEGARMRQRLALALGTETPYIVNWSVDVEDWLWAQSSTPEKQLDAFKRDLAKGGNLVVMHYLYPSTVGYLREFIQLAKATGKQMMRVDQCMEDPNAPAL